MIKKSIIMSVGLSSAILTLGATDIHADEKGTVTTNVLNVRSGASTSHSIIGKLYKGNTVEILESSNGWYKVKLSNGQAGWANSSYISKPSNSTTPSNPESSISGYGKVTTNGLNVRSGSGTSYSAIAKLNKNETVKLLASSNGWYKVELSNKQTGWVNAKYITKADSPSTSTPSTPSANKQQAIVNLAKAQLGKPYVWGSEGPNSFDCSGLTYYLYKNAANITLPRTSTEQSKFGTTVSQSQLQPGDILFSSTNGTGKVSHVGIYIGNGEMIHSPKPGQNVQKANINTSYWKKTYLWAKRVL